MRSEARIVAIGFGVGLGSLLTVGLERGGTAADETGAGVCEALIVDKVGGGAYGTLEFNVKYTSTTPRASTPTARTATMSLWRDVNPFLRRMRVI